MAVFPSMTITNLGQILYNKVQAGQTLTFTKTFKFNNLQV